MSLSLLRLERKQKILQIHFEFAYFSFFLTHLQLKRWIRSYTPVILSKTISDSRPKWAKSIPVFRPKWAKCIPVFRPKWAKCIPVFRQKGAKCIPVFRPKRHKNPTRWGGTYLYSLYKGLPLPRGLCRCLLNLSIFQMSFYIWDRYGRRGILRQKYTIYFKV